MKSIASSSIKKSKKLPLTHNSEIAELFPRNKLSKSAESLVSAGIKSIEDLFWLFPLRVQEMPKSNNFSSMEDQSQFKGIGKVISIQSRPSFKGRGRGGRNLLNISASVQDHFSDKLITFKWFNSYPSILNKLKKGNIVGFLGEVTLYQGAFQIINPEFQEISEETISLFIENDKKSKPEKKIQYPTTNKVSSHHIISIIKKIPLSLWNEIEDFIPLEFREKRDLIHLKDAFKIIHNIDESWESALEEDARRRMIFQEFFLEQIKIQVRRSKNKDTASFPMTIKKEKFKTLKEIYPYVLTTDQSKVLDDIRDDFKSPHPMMRMIQGDVGCGKTSVAVISSLIATQNNYQVALMCPTEALALQHYNGISELLPDHNIKILLGSTKAKDKSEILTNLQDGSIQLIIGTHSLIQDKVNFKNLNLVIIDEQHKFGVKQRIKLIKKGKNPHCLIMTATPIPRSLSLTNYGDLDISTIKTMPIGRKGHKTKVINPDNYDKFLSFINTRINMGEQVYIVVPAISESESHDLLYLEQVLERFSNFFPQFKVEGLHGQLKSDEKISTFKKFKEGKINILISTSVIEVGIDVLNATTIGIMNPERFGLSSLHQLRGRVGRGDRPGFCFLVNDKMISSYAMERLKVLESTNDGFKIAEEDLKIRGEGDLFGTDQSGVATKRYFANIIIHQDILLTVKKDLDQLIVEENPKVLQLIQKIKVETDTTLTV